MDQPGSAQPPPSSSTTANPVVAVGRKVKSIFRSHQQPSIRIRRKSAAAGQPRRAPVSQDFAEKPLPQLPTPVTAQDPESHAGLAPHHEIPWEAPTTPKRERGFSNRLSGVRSRAGSIFRRPENVRDKNDEAGEDCYDTETVDLLDVMDPEVATLSTLTNVQNSLFVPSLGRLVNRRPTYRVSESTDEASTVAKLKIKLKEIASLRHQGDEQDGEPEPGQQQKQLRVARSTALDNAQYAVIPNGETLQGWTPEEKEELDDLVRHKLHSRRAKMKRALKGFGQYVRRPLGLFITVYATLITLFGAAWVLFLIGWISVGSKRDYVVNVVDNVLVALFAIIGDGLAPFRAVDTYHMVYIAYYHRKTWRKREKLGLPKLTDHNDLPNQRKENIKPAEVDLESLVARRMPRRLAARVAPRIPKRLANRMIARNQTLEEPSFDYTVLTEEEQTKLEFHERKFSKSHTFYKPHETETHYAFPLKLLVAVVLLLDCHSCLQISLGACTWGIPYQTRSFALTTVILCCSITCNIMGGVLISIGDKRTRKKDVVERMMRQELTAEAIEQMETRWMKEAEERGELDISVRKKFEEEKDAEENEEIKKQWKVVPSLPKTLLGKGEDHRQPSLPQEARRSGSHLNVAATSSGASTPRKGKNRSNVALPSLQEHQAGPAHPEPVVARGAEPPQEGRGQKVMRFIRRADFDRS